MEKSPSHQRSCRSATRRLDSKAEKRITQEYIPRCLGLESVPIPSVLAYSPNIGPRQCCFFEMVCKQWYKNINKRSKMQAKKWPIFSKFAICAPIYRGSMWVDDMVSSNVNHVAEESYI